MQNEIENLEFFDTLSFAPISSLKRNGTKYLLIFDGSCKAISSSKMLMLLLLENACNESFFPTHNLFYQSKPGQDVQPLKPHLAIFKSPRDVKPLSTLCAQLGLGSQLADCHPDATSVPDNHLLFDWWP